MLIQEKTKKKSYNQDEWKRGYESQLNEYNYWVEDIEGEIPHQLQGTFLGMALVYLRLMGHPLNILLMEMEWYAPSPLKMGEFILKTVT